MKMKSGIALDRNRKRFLDLDYILGQSPRIGRDALLAEHWKSHPRYEFFKSLPLNCRLLDVGAGPGGLHFWRGWGEPLREDITIAGIDKSAEGFEVLYEDAQIADLEVSRFKFADASFDGVIMSHVLEHIESIDLVFEETMRVLAPGGRLYIETPCPETVDFTSMSELAKHNIQSSTFNFFDDATHVRPWSLEELTGRLGSMGLAIMKHGRIEGSADLAIDLLRYGITFMDPELTTYGLWRLTAWCSYLLCERP